MRANLSGEAGAAGCGTGLLTGACLFSTFSFGKVVMFLKNDKINFALKKFAGFSFLALSEVGGKDGKGSKRQARTESRRSAMHVAGGTGTCGLYIIWSANCAVNLQLAFHHLECNFATKSAAPISSSGVQIAHSNSSAQFRASKVEK